MGKRRSLKIEVLPTAQFDLREIVAYIARDSVKYAQREKRLIITCIDKLKNFPELGTELNYKNVAARQLVFRNYLIIYRLKNEYLIEVLTIHHHARLLSNNSAFSDDDE